MGALPPRDVRLATVVGSSHGALGGANRAELPPRSGPPAVGGDPGGGPPAPQRYRSPRTGTGGQMTDTQVEAQDGVAEDAETTALRQEIRSWLASNWDPDLTVAEWWERLADDHWAVPTWPESDFGRGLSRGDAAVVAKEIAAAGAIGPPGGLGVMLAGPTIVAHGDEEQKRRYLRPIVTGQEAWCQLFSEPGAGSDLAGLAARAVRDGDEWIVNGQKVWTSGGQIADRGMLLART